MGKTKKRNCRDYSPGKFVKTVAGQWRTRTKVHATYYQIGEILPIDKKLAAKEFPGDDTKIGKFCVEVKRDRYPYIYVDYSKELNPDPKTTLLGKKFQELSGNVKIMKSPPVRNNKTRKVKA